MNDSYVSLSLRELRTMSSHADAVVTFLSELAVAEPMETFHVIMKRANALSALLNLESLTSEPRSGTPQDHGLEERLEDDDGVSGRREDVRAVRHEASAQRQLERVFAEQIRAATRRRPRSRKSRSRSSRRRRR